MVGDEIEIDGDLNIRKCPRRGLTVEVPLPLLERLRRLTALADDAGENTTQTELVCAILGTFLTEGEGFHQLLQNYRTKNAAEIALRTSEAASVLQIVPLKRGRPRRS